MSDVNSVLKCKIWSYHEKLEYTPTRSGWVPPGQVRMGVSPNQNWGTPMPGLGYPYQVRMGTPWPGLGYPLARSGWGTPNQDWGTPQVRMGYLPGIGYTWTGYPAGGMPLVVSHRTFLLPWNEFTSSTTQRGQTSFSKLNSIESTESIKFAEYYFS